ncbi:MAG: hypothetical protein COU90_03545 [Candidatus Ryanbacteria bacterium CG10_big_fil_rev_8_21_14_0_10_43_42]|uniref:ATP-grasp fold RimK-type domain-containing protein n=1 Tax=Candidatus Ryanbacteria bacterium CG10_big_fil_rev_8_21_14_0_10_43_42 TaxID=1974864 RepID=A0A2M8KWF7_9BACT|nr:MAG: hypothetical protein COU90_03545 [Candidatus Ryanbacteria bacterium CG10_big_fil_rev_8_21_14_0_10_43_42]
MDKTILIVTHRRGFEADPVIDELRRRNVKVFRFNGDAGEEASLASFISKTGGVEFICDGRHIVKTDIAIGWCQQLPPYLGQAASESECLQRESLRTIQFSAFDLLSTQWFNKPSNVLHASQKIHQIVAAQTAQLTVPDTLASNNPRTIRQFATGRQIIAKNLATPWVVSHEITRAAYTRIIDPAWLQDDATLSFAPVIYQEYHERKQDIRVVVVNDKVFAASCIPGPHQREDVRKESGTGESFKVCEFDLNALSKLRQLMRALSLDYCAADFMENTEGNLFFLEVNTCGAWWWLDRLYNGAICQSIADALVCRASG